MDTLSMAIANAREQGERSAAVEPRATSAKFDAQRRRLVLILDSGAELSVAVEALGLPLNTDFGSVRVEGGGFDLYFPLADEGVFVPDLVRTALGRLAA